MPMQAKAEGVKLFHAKEQLWALLGFFLVLLWFANSGTMYFMVVCRLAGVQSVGAGGGGQGM